jgi:DNA-binding GntR family transcriptional regulator
MRSASLPAGERVYRELKDRLMGGHYSGGQRLNADGLSAEFGVSRQPVFDAFKRLSAESFVVVRPHVGCSVASYELSEISDYFHIFAAVEGESTALAAERRMVDDLPPLRRLHAQIGGLDDLADTDERAQGYRALNREFHSLIHRMCGTAIVETVGSGMYDRADFFINTAAAASPIADQISARHRDHGAIVAALEAGDPQAARVAASAHIVGTVALIEQTIVRSGARGVA